MMRRTLAALAALGLAASLAAPIFAQDILGMSLRPAPGSKDLAGTGLIDITRGEKAGNFNVKVDLSKAAESLDLSKFEGAGAFVVWAVDMEGLRHSLGALDDKMVLADTLVDYTVAKVYVTAEANAKVAAPSAPLYVVTLRQVTEQESAPAADSKAVAAAATATTDSKATAPTTAAAGSTTAASPTAVAKADAKPSTLPTTGSGTSDLLVMGLLALLFVGVGLKLSGSRA
ncbi:MAG: hypothetical protein ACH37Z_07870 [Anaerolineae bacterium]